MKPITLGLLALFAVAASSGVAFAECAGHVVKTTPPTTVATTRWFESRAAPMASRKRTRRMVPSPPRWAPAPPEPRKKRS
jgi:hypothetical protein